jgi:hypothetical protein
MNRERGPEYLIHDPDNRERVPEGRERYPENRDRDPVDRECSPDDRDHAPEDQDGDSPAVGQNPEGRASRKVPYPSDRTVSVA